VYFSPSGASKAIDDAPLSMATMVAVIFRTISCLPLVGPCTMGSLSESSTTAGSPAGFNRTDTLLL
jgi:hypothetical protein